MKRPWKISSFLTLATLLAVVFGCLLFPRIATATNPTTMSFQGKVVNANGTNVTDGTYSFVFKLYTVSSAGSAIWTETQSSVTVAAGVFQVNLGSVCPFFTANACNGSTPIDFNADPNLYLGITFNSDPAGEMTPRVQLQSVPFAFNADRIGGLTVSQLVQLSPGSQQSGFINVSGASTFGGALTVQSGGANITGDIGVSGNTTLSGDLTINGGGQAILLNGPTANYINYGQTGFGAPSFNTRSVGTKLVLFDNLSATSADYAIGIESSTLWNSVPTTSQQFKWYGGTTLAALLSGGGDLTLASGTGALTSGLINGQTISSAANFTGTLNITGDTTMGGNLIFSGTAARTITGPSTGGLGLTVASGPLTLSTTTAGTLAVTSAGALNLSGAAPSSWSIGTGNALTLISSNLQLANTGLLSLLGGQTTDITTLTAGAGLTVKPSILTTAGGTGGAINITGGEESGNTNSFGGAINITGGADTGASGNRTGGSVTILGGDATNGGGSTRTGGSVRIDAGSSNVNGSVTIGNVNAAGITLGHTGITTTSNGNLTLAANQILTLNAGTGTIVQTYTTGAAGAAASAQSLNLNNTNTGAGIVLQGHSITPANASTPSSGVNTINGFNFAAGTLSGSNVTNGLNFASATGYTNFINTPSFVLSSAGAISGVTTLSAATLNATTGINTGASGGTQRIDSSGNLVNIGNLTAAGNLTVTNTGAGNDITVTSLDQITLGTGTNGLLVTSTGATAATITDGTNTLAKVIDANVSGVNYGILQLGAKASTGNEAAQCAAAGDVGKIYVNSTDKAVFACTAANAWEQLDNGRTNQLFTAGTFTASTTDTVVDSLAITPTTANSDVWITYSSTITLNCTGIGCNQPVVAIRVVRGTTCAGTQLQTTSYTGAITTSVVTFNIVDTAPTSGSSNTYVVCAQRTAGSGTITNTLTSRGFVLHEVDTTGADYAEVYYSAHGDIASGTVVAADPTIKAGVKPTASRYQKGLLGVVSTQPGNVLSDHTDSGMPIIVGLAGRVPVKVSSENGPIHIGDALTSSSTAGVAMKATKAGAIIGTALTEFTDQGSGEVMLFVSTGQSAGTLPVTADNNQVESRQLLADLVAGRVEAAKAPDLSSIFTDRLAAAVEIVTPKVVADTVQTNSVVVGKNGLNFIDESGKVVASIDPTGTFHGDSVPASLLAAAVPVDTPPAGSPTKPILQTDEAAITDTFVHKDGTFQLLNPAGEAVLSIDGTGNAKFSGNVDLASASLSGGLTVGGDASFTGLSSFQKLATFLGKTIFRQDVEFNGHITVASDTAGYAKLRADETKVHVDFTNPYPIPPIVSATITDGQFVIYTVDKVKADGFDITLKDPATGPIVFSWTAIGVNNPRTAANPAPPAPQ